MSVLGTMSHSLCIRHLAIKLYCIVLYCIVCICVGQGPVCIMCFRVHSETSSLMTWKNHKNVVSRKGWSKIMYAFVICICNYENLSIVNDSHDIVVIRGFISIWTILICVLFLKIIMIVRLHFIFQFKSCFQIQSRHKFQDLFSFLSSAYLYFTPDKLLCDRLPHWNSPGGLVS